MVLREGEKQSSGGDDHGSGNDETLRAQNGRHGRRRRRGNKGTEERGKWKPKVEFVCGILLYLDQSKKMGGGVELGKQL